jgi:hypothetical protein
MLSWVIVCAQQEKCLSLNTRNSIISHLFHYRESNMLAMAPEIHMPEPLCLIENTEEQLVVNQEALDILSAITQPVMVVAIIGLYHTGKFYLMNKLAGQKKSECYQQSCEDPLLSIHTISIQHRDMRR